MNDFKIILLLAGMAVASAIIRFKTFTQLCIDALLGFTMGYSFYLMLSLWITDGATRSGISGLIILCSRPLYDWANSFIRNKLSDLIMKGKEDVDNKRD